MEERISGHDSLQEFIPQQGSGGPIDFQFFEPRHEGGEVRANIGLQLMKVERVTWVSFGYETGRRLSPDKLKEGAIKKHCKLTKVLAVCRSTCGCSTFCDEQHAIPLAFCTKSNGRNEFLVPDGHNWPTFQVKIAVVVNFLPCRRLEITFGF